MCLIEEILSACVVAAERAGDVIRAVQAAREAGEPLAASLKDADDSSTYLTAADQRAQRVVFAALRAAFGDALRLIGEEDEAETLDATAAWAAAHPEALAFGSVDLGRCRGLFAEGAAQGSPFGWVELKDVCVFVDPVDGTREFVRGNLAACQTLLGVAVRGKPVAGVMALPFYNSATEVAEPASAASGHVICGAVGVGVSGLEPRAARAEGAPLRLAISASASKSAEAAAVASYIDAAETVSRGGTAFKVLALLQNEADVAVLNLGTSLWDTCATEAVLAAAGGTLTTYHGNSIEHTHTPGQTTTLNRFGVLASAKGLAGKPNRAGMKRSHEELAKGLCGVGEVHRLLGAIGVPHDAPPQAADMLRGIDGRYFRADDLSQILCGRPGCVAGFSAAEAEAVRYKQSYACRVRVTAAPDAPVKPPGSLFYKRIVLRDMPYQVQKARQFPHKIDRDVRANAAEANFLASPCLRAFSAASGVAVAPAVDVAQEVFASHPLDSRFGVLLEDLSHEAGWAQYPHLAAPQLRAALQTLAKFHAFFWLGERAEGAPAASNDVLALREKLWPAATYVDLASQAKDQVASIDRMWRQFLERFGGRAEVPDAVKADETFGARLAAIAEPLNRCTHGVDAEGARLAAPCANFVRRQTLIHGDAKAGNFFFRGDAAAPETAVIDYQWTGGGLGTTDVAYCIAACIHPDDIAPGGDEDIPLVQHYHRCLLEALAAFKVCPTVEAAEAMYPWVDLRADYVRSMTDLGRTIVCDHWSRVTPATLDGRHMANAFNAYNKSTKCTGWLAARLQVYLNEVNLPEGA